MSTAIRSYRSLAKKYGLSPKTVSDFFRIKGIPPLPMESNAKGKGVDAYGESLLKRFVESGKSRLEPAQSS